MRKTLKKIVSFVTAVALVMFMGTVRNVGAAPTTCVKHGDYKDNYGGGGYWSTTHTFTDWDYTCGKGIEIIHV